MLQGGNSPAVSAFYMDHQQNSGNYVAAKYTLKWFIEVLERLLDSKVLGEQSL